MFKKDYSWIDEYIHWAETNGHPLTASAFEECKKELNRLQEENIKLKRELNKYKPRVKKERKAMKPP